MIQYCCHISYFCIFKTLKIVICPLQRHIVNILSHMAVTVKNIEHTVLPFLSLGWNKIWHQPWLEETFNKLSISKSVLASFSQRRASLFNAVYII